MRLVTYLTDVKSPDEIKEQLKTEYPSYQSRSISMNAGQINRFINEFKIDDYAIR